MGALGDLIDGVAGIISDLKGCTPEDLECQKQSRKYALYIVVGFIVVIVLVVGLKIWGFVRGRKK